jgi:hypothetical protein
VVFLRIHPAIVLAALLFWGCQFDPAVTGLGYQPCDTTDACTSGGMVCLKGLCVPDCSGAYTVARIEPESQDDIGDHFKMICPGGLCEIAEEYLYGELLPGTFIELGSTKKEEEVEGCSRVVIRLSILAPDMAPEPQGRELSVVVRGVDATGVIPDTLTLQKVDPEGNIVRQFLENTRFYVVDTGIFAWPVRLRLVPIASNTTAYFAIRGFEMSCCQ